MVYVFSLLESCHGFCLLSTLILTTPKGIKEDRTEISGEFLAYLSQLSSVFGLFHQVTPFLRNYAGTRAIRHDDDEDERRT